MPLADSGSIWQHCLALVRSQREDRARPDAAALQAIERVLAQPSADRALAELYWPILAQNDGTARVYAHLGQSIDGKVAALSGDSRFVTGQANLVHLHRMRALCDAILVGASTADLDDPRLTTRLVDGDNPVRVVLDPLLRVPAGRSVFHDGLAPTLVVCDPSRAEAAADRVGRHNVVAVPAVDGRCAPWAVVEALQDRGILRLFVEGGGLTVSRFLSAGAVDRLHVAVAPLLIGDGRQGLSLPGRDVLRDCARPRCRVFRMGEDLLWDFDLRSDDAPATDGPAAETGVSRVF